MVEVLHLHLHRRLWSHGRRKAHYSSFQRYFQLPLTSHEFWHENKIWAHISVHLLMAMCSNSSIQMTEDCPTSCVPATHVLNSCSDSKFACDLLYKWSTHASRAAAMCNKGNQGLKT